MRSDDKKLTALRQKITESLRIQRDSSEAVPYIDAANILGDVCARQNHAIFARRGCGKTLLLHYSSRSVDDSVRTVYLNCEDFKRHSFPNVLIEILDALFGEVDVLSLHVPLTESTRGLVDAARLARMKPDAILVNTARGGVVDETALAAALRSGKLGGAALDVFDDEPLRAGSPLAGAPNLILTPHIGGVTRESNERVSSLIAERIRAFFSA